MPYIGQSPSTGQFIELDALTASATDTYTLQLNSANFAPGSVNNLIVSINGVVQKPSSMSLNGSSLTVGATLSSSDTIDYVRVLGHVGSVVTPTDGSVTSSKLATSLDFQNITIKGGSTNAMTVDSSGRILTPARPAFRAHKTNGNVSATNTYVPNVASFNVGSHYSTSTGKFTCPINGVYVFYANILSATNQTSNDLNLYLNNTELTDYRLVRSRVDNGGNSDAYATANIHFVGSFSASDEVSLQVTDGEFFGTDRTWAQFGGYLLG